MSDSKPYKPSRRKLRRARREGKSPKSQLVSQFFSLFAGVVVVLVVTPFCWLRFQSLVNYLYIEGFSDPVSCLLSGMTYGGAALLAVLGAGALSGNICESLQTGVMVTPDLLYPKLSRLSPSQGLLRLGRNIKDSWFAALRIVVLAAFFFGFLSEIVRAVPGLFWLDASARFTWLVTCVVRLTTYGTAALGCFAAIDFVKKRRMFLQELSMTLEEVRREHREDEGDANMKAMRRSLHAATISQDLVTRIRKSKVIIVERF